MQKDDLEMPVGFGMALAMNTSAMEYFAGLARSEQEDILRHVRAIATHQEMQAYVNGLGSKHKSS